MLETVIDVVLPVLDEAAALPWVLSRVPFGCRPIVVDNGSSDGSGDIALNAGAVVVREPKRGFGSACAAGLRVATNPVVCFMDADASLDPADLPLVLAGVLDGRADLVLGARRPERWAWPLHARLGNRLLALEVGRRTGLSLRDLGPMRAARLERLRSLQLDDRRSGWPLEMILRACSEGLLIEEVQVPYRPRVGCSKVTGSVRGTLRAMKDISAVLRAA